MLHESHIENISMGNYGFWKCYLKIILLIILMAPMTLEFLVTTSTLLRYKHLPPARALPSVMVVVVIMMIMNMDWIWNVFMDRNMDFFVDGNVLYNRDMNFLNMMMRVVVRGHMYNYVLAVR